MKALTKEQEDAVNYTGSVLVTACPGSGKTRVLTYRVVRGLQELISSKHRVVAMTFTNRAADELQVRLDRLAIDTAQLWSGTIHAFALEWIVRPYIPYMAELRSGFSVADEFYTERLLLDLRREFSAPRFLEISTAWKRDGQLDNDDDLANDIGREYKRRLRDSKLLDYDDILYYAFKLLAENPEIAQTLSSILRLICVDEIQDTQDLQYGILSEIIRASAEPPILFFVGDLDQSIYESLGSLPKSADEIATELSLPKIENLHLTGNYRSTQRVIDFCQHLRPQKRRIESLAKYKDERGCISYHDHSVSADDLPALVAQLISTSLAEQVRPDDICVLAPQWWQVRALGRSLVQLLPDVGFDAPGLSPLHAQRDNIWFKLSRLMLTVPTPPLYITRLRWSGELIRDLHSHGVVCPEGLHSARQLLRFTNSISPVHENGLSFLTEAFETFAAGVGLRIESHPVLADSHASFFAKAKERLQGLGDEKLAYLSSFRRLFRQPSGVVIATCHAVKGEEYNTVIALSLLEGYIPNWRVLIHGTDEQAYDQSSKLLYVIASRAKKRLHLISETGRFTNSRKEYLPSKVVRAVRFGYDLV